MDRGWGDRRKTLFQQTKKPPQFGAINSSAGVGPERELEFLGVLDQALSIIATLSSVRNQLSNEAISYPSDAPNLVQEFFLAIVNRDSRVPFFV